jgi:hypothetical protein
VVTAVGFALFRGAVIRAALLALGLTLIAFSYYGWLDVETWQDYGWRWPAVLLATAGYLAVFALAPAMLGALRRRARVVQIAALLIFVLPIYALRSKSPPTRCAMEPEPVARHACGFLLIGLCRRDPSERRRRILVGAHGEGATGSPRTTAAALAGVPRSSLRTTTAPDSSCSRCPPRSSSRSCCGAPHAPARPRRVRRGC